MNQNETVMFKPVPEPVEQEITFNLIEKELVNWLEELPSADSFLFCKSVFLFLQNFNKLSLNINKKNALLQIILKHISVHADQLESSFLDSSFPLSEQENMNAEILVWLYFELARGFAQSIEKTEGFGKKRQAAALMNQSFYCLSQAFLFMNEVYAEPFPGFWQQCYALYRKAEHDKLLTQEVKNQNSTQTVQNYFNLIIILELSGTNQFRSRHIKRIYEYIENFIEHSKVTKKVEAKYLKSYYKFDLDSDTGPSRITSDAIETNDSMRFITPVIIAKKMYRDIQKNSLNEDNKSSIHNKIFLKAVNNLGMAQFRKNSRIKKDQACTGVIGLKNLINLLKQDDDTLQEIFEPEQKPEPNKPDTRIAGQWEVPDLELVPFGEETAHQMRETYKTKIWHNKKLDRIFSAYQDDTSSKANSDLDTEGAQEEISFQGFEILDSSPQGHRVLCKSENFKVRTGDVLGIVPDFTGRIELGLVCRLNNSYFEGVSLGVKILSLETKLARMQHRGGEEHVIPVLFLPGTLSIHKTDCVVFNSSHYKSGDKVLITVEGKKHRAELGKLINANSSISHVEISTMDDE